MGERRFKIDRETAVATMASAKLSVLEAITPRCEAARSLQAPLDVLVF
jgi:hypothetical protein